MRPTPVCDPFDPVVDATARLLDEQIDALPVVAHDGSGRLIGWLTPRDVAAVAARDPGSLGALQVRSAMTPPGSACAPETTAEQALERMREAGVGRLAVLDTDGCLRGVVSLVDLAASAGGANEQGDRLRNGICQTLAAHARGGDRPRAPGEGPPGEGGAR